MEVCKGQSATNESDMGVCDEDALPALCRYCWNHIVAMEGNKLVSWGDAEVCITAPCCGIVGLEKLLIADAMSRFYCWGPSKPPMMMTLNEQADWTAHLQTPVIFNHHEPLVVNSTTIKRVDLNPIRSTPKAVLNEERVLILTPLRDAAQFLPKYFDLLSELTYPHHLIDLGFLVGDSKDDTLAVLAAELDRIQGQQDGNVPFNSVLIVEKDFGVATTQSVEERHGFAAQAPRRKAMARARNYLLTAALKPEHSWVYWRDSDIVDSPKKILEDFVAHDRDIIVPSEIRLLFLSSFANANRHLVPPIQRQPRY